MDDEFVGFYTSATPQSLRKRARDLLLNALDGEALYAIASDLKPMSSGDYSTDIAVHQVFSDYMARRTRHIVNDDSANVLALVREWFDDGHRRGAAVQRRDQARGPDDPLRLQAPAGGLPFTSGARSSVG